MARDAVRHRRSPATRRLTGGFLLVSVISMSAACRDDGPPTQQPATTLPPSGPATPTTQELPTGGTSDVEPGTNLVPTSDQVPGPSSSGAP